MVKQFDLHTKYPMRRIGHEGHTIHLDIICRKHKKNSVIWHNQVLDSPWLYPGKWQAEMSKTITKTRCSQEPKQVGCNSTTWKSTVFEPLFCVDGLRNVITKGYKGIQKPFRYAMSSNRTQTKWTPRIWDTNICKRLWINKETMSLCL